MTRNPYQELDDFFAGLPTPTVSREEWKRNRRQEANSGIRRRRAPEDAAAAQDTEVKSSAATKLTELLMMATEELWHTPADEPFATFKDAINGTVLHFPVLDSSFVEYASLIYWRNYGSSIASDATRAAINTISAKAKFDGPEHDVYSRIAHRGDVIWIDLCDDQRRAVRIDARGWQVVSSVDIEPRFRRSKASGPLQEPKAGGTLELIRRLFPNIDDEAWFLLQGWMLGTFQQSGARAFLELIGGQGSGKSTLQRLLIWILDPCQIPSRSVPRDEQALMIATLGRSVLAFDNVSSIDAQMADAWCRISTGGGIGQRKLHSDTEEVMLEAQLPIVTTAITPVAASRPDLQDRTLTVYLGRLQDTTYRPEREFNEVAQEVIPEILGALYTAVSCALRRVGSFELDRLPRLADFALWVEAAAPALGWPEGAFVEALSASRDSAMAQVVESNTVASLILQFMIGRPEWTGPSAALLEELRNLASDSVRRSRTFPTDATRLSSQLRRTQGPLAASGIDVDFVRTRDSRYVILRRCAAFTDTPAQEEF